ncbi:hypothetical protein [Siphonobacter sp. BAB-5385]|uniref:hypothetical protein n=1 Tax=Siphonobacter sp. BAB-5385 TaxID=1864822 RepID=UPI0015961E9C|nr:hypothetical protein [Siphonobacter sp. BAB-5385]
MWAIFSSQSLTAQSLQMNQTPPPYIAKTSNFMAIAFQVKAGDAQTLVPANLKVKSNEQGLVTGGMEIYTTDQTSGIPSYSIAFIYLEVMSQEQAGNWPIWGAVSDVKALEHFKHFYNFPYIHKKIKIETRGNQQMASIGEGEEEGLMLSLQKQMDKAVASKGLARIYSYSTEGQMLLTEIPWLASGHQGKVLSLEIRAGKNKTLQLLEGVQPSYSQISTNAFSYSKPLKQ